MSERADIAALLADPARAADVPADERLAVLDVLAVHEGRCRLVRELLTVNLAGTAEAKNGGAGPQPPYTVQEAAGLLQKSTAWLQRKAKTGRVPGAHKVGRSWLFDRAPFDRWRSRREVG
jgi:excisionase family DNA binding protein